ncbi:MAG TPA: ATP-binding protein [Planctomycetota bacterium]|nr:ATP-binding protein [Planctomycetota bacterium]
MTQSPTPTSTSLRSTKPTTPGVLIVGEPTLKAFLEDQGWFVATSDVEHATDALRTRPFDIVLVPGDLLNDPASVAPGKPNEAPALLLLDRLRRTGVAPIVVGGPVDKFPQAFSRGAMGAVVHPEDKDEVKTTLAVVGVRRKAEKERLDALDEARRTRKFYEDVLRGLGEGIVVIDDEARIRYRNPEAARILGEDDDATPAQDAATSMRLKQLVLAPLLQLLVETLTEREAKTRMVALEEAEEKVFLDVTTSVLRSGDGRAQGAVGVIRDRSAEKILEEQLAHTERLATLGSLLASIAHEIANPLSVITGCAEIGQDTAKEAAQAAQETNDPHAKDVLERLSKDMRDILEQVRDAGLRCQTIANNLLQYSRRTPARVAEQDLNELVRKTLGWVGKYLQTDKVEVDLQLDVKLPQVRCDAAQLQQAVTNLVDNAVQAMLGQRKAAKTPLGPGGPSQSTTSVNLKLGPARLSISTRVEDGKAVLVIGDNGPGIPPRQLERIWRPFYTTKERGTGLGLYITRRAVEHQGGTIALESKVGVGTTFTIRLPL